MEEVEYYTFDCGCRVKILDKEIKQCDGLPSIEYDYYHLPNCKKTWESMHTGKTKGIFQVEKSLGKHWCKEIMPTNILDLSALIALIRPSCLESVINGKSLTQNYADSKNGKQEKIEIHPALNKILEETQNIICYQENAIIISQEIAGFDGIQADNLRKGIGHKDAAILFGLEKEFIEGCLKVGKVSESDARMIFDIIKKGARYSFNKCLSPSTVVETKNCFKTIDDIEIGDFIKCPGDNGDEFIEVLDKIEQGEQDLYEVTLEDGKTIECTLDHKFLCDNGEILPLLDIIQYNLSILCESE